jgi:hypothetical protein
MLPALSKTDGNIDPGARRRQNGGILLSNWFDNSFTKERYYPRFWFKLTFETFDQDASKCSAQTTHFTFRRNS